MVDIILYSKTDCHLCEQAEHLLNTLGLSFDKLDIMQDAALLASYGQYIPVLKYKDQTIVWPFDEEKIRSVFAL